MVDKSTPPPVRPGIGQDGALKRPPTSGRPAPPTPQVVRTPPRPPSPPSSPLPKK